MVRMIAAVYENGVFRPTEPVELAEGSRVQIPVPAARGVARPRPIAEALADIAGLPLENSADTFSGADHDEVLYQRGGPDADVR